MLRDPGSVNSARLADNIFNPRNLQDDVAAYEIGEIFHMGRGVLHALTYKTKVSGSDKVR
jgi:hypothetical protein